MRPQSYQIFGFWPI